MLLDVADTRIVAATSATLSFQGVDSDGEPADPGTVTVGVVDAYGTEVLAPGTATIMADTMRTVALTAAQTALVDRLTATWTSGGVVVGRTQHDVVGGVYVNTATIRADGISALADELKHEAAELIQARTEVEYQFEGSCHRAFVPRFSTEIIESRGGSTLVLRVPNLREVVWAQQSWDGTTWTDVTASVATVQPSDAGLATLGSGCWPAGLIRIGYRHGMDRCPPDLRKAAIEAISYRIHSDRSGLDPRATNFVSTETGTLQLATPGLGIWVTAIPTVDAVLKAYRWHQVGIA